MTGLDIRRVRTHHQSQAQIFSLMRRICKEQRIKERQQSNKRKKARKPLPTVDYAVVADNGKTLRLRNGTVLRQAIPGVGLYLSQGGRVYSLTAFGLRPRRIRFLKKNNYGKKSANGVPNGQRYPYVDFRRKKYDVHILVTIDDCRLINLRIVTKEENRRCAQILRRLRKAAKQLNDPSLDPLNIPQPRLLKIFATLTVDDPTKIMDDDFTHYREF